MPVYKYKNTAGKTLWYCSFYYTDWLGQKKRKVKRGFQTQREAKAWEAMFLDQRQKDPTITFSGLVENYFKEMDTRLKPTTIENKQWIIGKKLLPFFGDMRICDIDPVTVMRWQNELMNYRDEKGKPFSQTYLKTINDQLSSLLNYAVRYYGLRSNPCAAVGGMGKGKAGEMKFWTKNQFDRFIACEKRTAYHLAFSLLFYSGIREGELLALYPGDIRDDAVDINKNYAVVKGQEMILTPKTESSIRVVDIPHSLYAELRDYIDGCQVKPDERVFYFSKGALTEEFKRCTKRAGLPPIRIHDCRHSHVAMLIEMGVPIEQISKRLGHQSTSITWDTYAHLYPGKDKEIARKLEDVRTGKERTK